MYCAVYVYYIFNYSKKKKKKKIILTFEPQPAGPTFARCALRGGRAGPKRTYGDIHIYKYINIYTRNLKFAQLVTELASLAII